MTYRCLSSTLTILCLVSSVPAAAAPAMCGPPSVVRAGRHNVLVLDLMGPGGPVGLAHSLSQALATMLATHVASATWQRELPAAVGVSALSCAASSAAEARRLGMQHGAAEVMWGTARWPGGFASHSELYLHVTQVAGGKDLALPRVIAWPAEPSQGVLTVSTGTVSPGPFDPGDQPVPCYIGNTVHDAIGKFYQIAHPGDQVLINSVSISNILQQLKRPVPAGTSTSLLAARPDITNLTRHHLYEIRPHSDAAGALKQALTYQQYLQRVGVSVTLGPIGEPGTFGLVPAPAAVAEFVAEAPGVIVYRCRRSREPKPVPVAQPEKQPRPSVEVLRSQPRSWEEYPLVQSIAKATGLTGTGLMLYLVVSEGLRITFPPRNAIPLP